ncbi:hypothetical protein G9A89_014611 [Geosiphon pyriformis]|nr:hypothetical protein G9A89_014611 [Geosiphon pyriformis]
MAKNAKIAVNTNLKKFADHLDQTVIIKKIPVGMSAKIGVIKLIKMQLVEFWQKTVVEFKQLDYADLVIANDYV